MREEQPQETLTQREHEIYDLLLAGSTPKEIAYNLDITLNTVVTHQKNMYRKLRVHNLNEFFVKYLSGYKDSNLHNKEYIQARFTTWHKSCDTNSTVDIIRTKEEINGRVEDCVIISGTMSDKPGAFSGIVCMPDDSTLKALRAMKSFSFKALGDGKDYFVKLQTTDNIEGSHWIYTFPTKKGEIITETVSVPDDLLCHTWKGKEAEFNRNNIIFVDFYAYPGQFNLKFWDIRLYK